MKVLALTSYPEEAAATRFRVGQFVGPLRERGIEMTISPFLDSGRFRSLYKSGGVVRKAFGMLRPLAGRVQEIFSLGGYDVIFVQREAMLFGPGLFEWLFTKIGKMPMVLDLDDATYVRYVSPSYGKLGSAFKFFGKTDNLIRRSHAVICGNRFIAEYVESLGGKAVVIPTVVDGELFKPIEKTNDVPVIGWIGTHSTYPFLESLFPVLERLAEKHKFILRIVGAGTDEINIKGVEIDNRKWSLEREVEDFQTLDIGLYPVVKSGSASDDWLMGKSGFKAVQYMAAGIPFVMSPVGVCAEMGEVNSTHFNAVDDEDWYNALDALLQSAKKRREIGKNGREFAIQHYSLEQQADKIEVLFREIVNVK